MKKITCIQNYVIDKLIDDEKISTGSLIDAMSKVCSEEQFNNILAILIETPIPCTKEDSGNKTNLVRMSMFIPEETNTPAKLNIIKILKDQFSLNIFEAKEYVYRCVGRYDILPKIVTQVEVDEVTKKLEPYSVIISTAGFY